MCHQLGDVKAKRGRADISYCADSGYITANPLQKPEVLLSQIEDDSKTGKPAFFMAN